jgi:Flp pilus assembly pilin Flp
MIELIRSFGQDERGQDLIEYSLLIAFVALSCTAIMIATGRTVPGVWASADTMLANANTYSAS